MTCRTLQSIYRTQATEESKALVLFNVVPLALASAAPMNKLMELLTGYRLLLSLFSFIFYFRHDPSNLITPGIG